MIMGGIFEKHRGLVLCVIATAIAAAPLAFIRFAPLHDYPFHLARMVILNDILHVGPMAHYYALGSFLLPNLGMDLVVVTLAQFMPVETASALFIVITLFLTIWGGTYLHRSLHEPDDLTPFLMAALTYNSIFTMGFLNYLFALGVMLWAIGLFVRLQASGETARFVWGCVAAFCVAFGHVAAFGVYAIVVAGLELQANWERLRAASLVGLLRLILSALPLFVVVGFFAFVSPTSGEVGDPLKFGGSTLYDFFLTKLWLATQVFSGHENSVLDLANTGLIVASGLIGLAFFNLRLATGGLLLLVLLCATFAVAPAALLSGSYLDARLPIAIALIAVGFSTVSIATPLLRFAVMTCVVLLLGLRSIVLAQDWASYDDVGKKFLAGFDCLPEGSVLFSARADLSEMQSFWQPATKHFASYATVSHAIFVPSVFAHPSQQPIAVQSRFEAISKFESPNILRVHGQTEFEAYVDGVRQAVSKVPADVREAIDNKIFVMLVEPHKAEDPRIANASVVATSDLFALYHVRGGSSEWRAAPQCRLNLHAD